MRNARSLSLWFVLLAACSADLPHEAPYDASAPLDKQAKASLAGTVVLEGETDYSQITLDLQNALRTYNVDTAADGKLSLTGIVPGTYTLSLRTRYFEGVTETITIGLGDTVNLGTRTLAPRKSRVLGQAVSERLVGAEIAQLGGVNLSLKKTGSIRSATASAPAYQASAVPPPAGYTLRTLSGTGGDYEFAAVPAGVYSLAAATPETGERDFGKVTVTGEGDVKVDPIVLKPLTGYFEIQGLANSVPSSTYTSVATVNLQLQQSNAVKVKVAVSTDGTTAGCNLAAAPKEALPSNTLRSLTFTSEGKKLVCVSYVDADGKETAPIYGTITYDTTPPSLPSVAVNGGAAVVSSNLVTLSLGAVDASGVTTYKIGTAAGVTATSAKAFQATDVATLGAGDGAKTVWVMFGDAAGNYSAPIAITVNLDTTVPTAGAVPSITRLDGTPLTTGDTIAEGRIKLVSAYSDATGLEMQISTTGSYTGQAWVPYDAAKLIDLPNGASSLSVRVRDGAGHVVDVVTAFALTTDTTPPTGTLNILAAAVTEPVVQVQATGSIDAVAVELAFDPGFVTSFGTFVPGPLSVTLAAGDGTKTVYARFFDAAGNASALVGDTVVLDTTPPQVLSVSLAQTSPTKDNPVTVQYTVSGAAELRVTEGAACGGIREPLGTGSRAYAVTASEGLKEIRVQFFDAAGNASECVARTIDFDPNPPVVGSLQINYGQAATSSNVVTLTFPGVSGATKVLVSEDAGFAGADWQSFAATKTFTLSAGNGVKMVYAKVADDAGHVVNLPSQTITLDTTPPSAPAIYAAADVTTQTSVLVTLSAGLVSDMWVTVDDPGFTTGAWETYTGLKTVTLGGADGTKTIYAKFKKSTGLETSVVNDTVVLDRAAPILPTVAVNGGAAVVTSNVVTLSLSAVDAASGLATYMVNTSNDFSAVSPKPFQPTDVFSFPPGDGVKTVWVTMGDKAGQYSTPVSASVVLDTTPPALGGAVTVTLAGGTPVGAGATIAQGRIVLNSIVSDASALQMQVSTSGSYAGAAWVPYEPAKLIELGSGVVSLSARVRDGAGLVTDLVTAFALTVDTTPPTGTLVIAPTAVTDPSITVQATGSADAVGVELAFDPGFVTSLGVFVPGPIAVTLTGGDGVKAVYARFFDAAGNASALVGDSVVLDTTPPQVLSVSIAQTSPTKDNPVSVLYSVSGAAELRVTEGAACGGIREPLGTGSRAYAVTASEGLKEIRVQFFDAAGNASACEARTVYFDPNPPVVGALQINYGQAATSSNVVTLSFPGVSGATRVMLSEDPGYAGAEWQAYAAAKTFLLSAGNGVKTVYAKVADDAGNVAGLPAASITLDTTPPSAPAIYAAADVTSQASVLVTLSAGLVSEMWVTVDDPDFTTGAWETYSGLKTVALSGSDGTKTIYAKFKKSTGVETSVVSDAVVLDRAAPILPSVQINGGAAVVGSSVVTLSLSAVDATSGLATYKVNTTNDFAAVSPKPYQSTDVFSFAPGDGLKTVWVVYGDRAGRYSAPASATVVVDTAAPALAGLVTLTLLDGTPLTTGDAVAVSRVVLNSSVSDASGLQMQVTTNGSYAGVAWVPYEPAKVIDLVTGASTIAARVRDGAGLVTDLVAGFALTVDTTPPTGTLVIAPTTVTAPAIMVQATGSADAVEVELAFDPGFVSSLGRFAPGPIAVSLTGGDGVKTVYGRFFDAAGNASALAGDTVELDTTPPQILSYTLAQASPTKENPLTVLYTVAGAAEFRVTEGAACGGIREPLGTGSRAYAVTASEGLKEIRVQFFDAAGNASECAVRSVYYDPNPPVVGTLQLNYGQSATSSNVVAASFTGVSGATKVMLSEDAGFAGADWQAYASTKTFVLSAGNGVKTVYAKVADDAGWVVNVPSANITLDTSTPAVPSIYAAVDVTTQTSVLLTLAAGVMQDMILSQDDPTFATATWEPYAGAKVFPLTGADGVKTIYAKFRKANLTETAVVSDTVILDRAAPTLASVRVDGGATVVSSASVVLNLSAVDAASGLATYKINTVNDFTAVTAQPFQSNVLYGLAGPDGLKTVWVTIGDRAGLYAAPVSTSVTLDTAPPVVTSAQVQTTVGTPLASGATIADTRVVLATTVTDLTGLQMQVSTTGSFAGAAWEPYTASKTVDLAAGTATLAVRVRDEAGHVTDVLSGFSLTVDTTPPSSPSLVINGKIGGAVSTATVSVTLSAAGGPVDAEIAYDPGFVTSLGSLAPNGTHTVPLPAGDGAKNLYVRFFDAAGNASALAGDSVVLDTTPPIASFTIAEAGPTKINPITINYTQAGATEFRITEGSDCSGIRVPVGSGSYAELLSSSEGTKQIRVQFFDAVGNASGCLAQSVYYDPNPPVVGAFQINYGQAATSSNVVTISFTGVSGATKVIVSEDTGFAGADWSSYAAAKTLVLSAGNGVKTVYAKVADDAGWVVGLPQQTITLDTTPPTNPAVYAAYEVTTQTSVLLTLAAGLVSEMWLTQDDAAFTTGAWEPFVGAKLFPLTGGDGAKTIYAKFRKATGVETAVASDTVVLDRAAPILPGLQINGGAAVVTSNVVTLNLSAVDTASGLYTYKVNTTNDFNAVSPKSYQPSDVFALAGGDGAKTIWVVYGDRAGLYSAPVSKTVTLDTTPPMAASANIAMLDGTPLTAGGYVTDNRVVLSSSVTDLSPLEMQVTTNGSFVGVAWVPYEPNKLIDLVTGTPSISARVRDGAGFVTNLVTAFNLTVDTAAPALSFARTSAAITSDPTVSLSLSANEPSQAQVSENPNFGAAPWFATANTTIVLPPGDGLRTIYARARDTAGNRSAVVSTTVQLDTVAPSGSVLINQGAAATVTNTVTLQISGVDTGSGVAGVKLADTFAGLAAASVVALEATKAYTLTGAAAPGVEETKTVWLQVVDRAGLTSPAVSDSIRFDRKNPVGTISLSSPVTNDTLVGVDLTFDADVAEMKLSAGNACAGGNWVGVSQKTVFTIPSLDGTQDVSVRFRDGVLNESTCYSKSVVLDRAGPTPQLWRLVGNAGAAIGYTNTPNLKIDAGTAAGDCSYAKIAEDVGFIAPTATGLACSLAAKPYSLWNTTDGFHTLYLRFYDTIGNPGPVSSTTIVLDTVAPQVAVAGGFTIAQGAYTSTPNLTLQLAADGATRVAFGEGAGCGFAPVAYQSTKPLALSGGDGPKTVSVRYSDEAANTSACYSRTVTLDTSPPTVSAAIVGAEAVSGRTAQLLVTLNLTLSADAYEIRVSNTSGFAGTSWQSASASLSWALFAGDGTKTIYVQARDRAGNLSAVAQPTITLDQVGPPIPTLQMADVTGDGFALSSSRVELLWNASSDPNIAGYELQRFVQGQDTMYLTIANLFAGAVTYAANVTLSTDHKHFFRIRARDDLGLYSAYSSVVESHPYTPPSQICLTGAGAPEEQYSVTWDRSELISDLVIQHLWYGQFGTAASETFASGAAEYLYQNLVSTTSDNTWRLKTSNWDSSLNYVSDFDLPSSHAEFVGLEAGAGNYASMKLDAQGKAHFAYYDSRASALNLIYATNESGSWVTTAVDAAGDVGSYASLAVDLAGNIHISYYDATNGNLKYVKRTAGVWGTRESPATSGDVGRYTSIAVDASNNPHISYYDVSNTDLKYIKKTGAVWGGSSVLSGSNDYGNFTSITVNSAGTSYYISSQQWNGGQIFVNATSMGSSSVAAHTKIGFSPGGELYVAYANSSGIVLRADRGGTWPVVWSSNSPGSYPSFAFASDGSIHVAYYNSTLGALTYATNDRGYWHERLLDDQGDVGKYTSIAVQGNTVYVGYVDATSSDELVKYTTLSRSDMRGRVIHSISGEYLAQESSLAIDGNGKYHIVYSRSNGFVGSGLLYYATNESGQWVTSLLVSGDVGQSQSILVDSVNNIHVAFFDAANRDLKYRKRTSGVWGSIETVDGSGGWNKGNSPSMAMDGSGKLHVVYLSDSAGDYSLYYAFKPSGGSWNTVSPLNYDTISAALDVDTAGKVHISYKSQSTTDLRYLTNASGSWVETTVDGGSDSIGGYSSIRVDSLGKVHISYYQNTAGDLKYATNSSGTWVKTVVDSTGNVGSETFLRLDASGKPHIVYNDDGNGNLKYATNRSGTWKIATLVEGASSGAIVYGPSNKVAVSYYDFATSGLGFTESAAFCTARKSLTQVQAF